MADLNDNKTMEDNDDRSLNNNMEVPKTFDKAFNNINNESNN